MRTHARLAWASVSAVALVTGGIVACGGGGTGAAPVVTAPGGTRDQSKWPADDRSMCDWKNKPELEVSESAGPGALRPNVRRVYKTMGEGVARHKTVICREIDTNLDGIKDVVRTFNQKGEALHEEADSDYDGRIDVWTKFVEGRRAEESFDKNRDGKPDEWKFYSDGQLQRIRRDRNYDGKPDVWEIYTRNGRLERMGFDETFDGHVDRWDRDEQLKYEAEAADRKARDEMMNAQMAANAAAQGDGGASQGGGDAGAAPGAGSKDGGAAPTSAGKDAGAPKAMATPQK